MGCAPAPRRPTLRASRLGGHGSHAGEGVELLERRRVQVHLPRRHRHPRRRRRHAHLTRAALQGHDDLLAVGHRSSEVHELESSFRLRAAGLGDGVVDATPLREAVEARLQDGSGDVHDQLLRRLRFDVERDRLRCRRGLGSVGAQGDAPRER